MKLTSKQFALELLPAGAYEASFINPYDSIGIAFDSQSGQHALGTDNQSQFYTLTNSTSYLPKGCDVFSRSERGGEYLKLSCYDDSLSRHFGSQIQSSMATGAALRIATHLRRLLLSAEQFCASHAIIDHCYFDALVDDWLVSLSAVPPSGFALARCRDIEAYCQRQLSEPLEVEALAREFGLSSGYFSRQFKASFGQSPYDYIIQRRIAHARYLLKASEQGITDIALACGFNSHAHMSAVFTRCLGVSPRHFRC